MVRAFRQEETLVCGGDEFTLAVDISIIDALEDEFDLPFDQLMAQFEKNARIGKLARLLRGLLSRHHPELGLDEIGGLLMTDSAAFGEAMERLFTKAKPDAAEGETRGANPPNAHRGATSSSHGARPASRRGSSGNKRRELSPSS